MASTQQATKTWGKAEASVKSTDLATRNDSVLHSSREMDHKDRRYEEAGSVMSQHTLNHEAHSFNNASEAQRPHIGDFNAAGSQDDEGGCSGSTYQLPARSNTETSYLPVPQIVRLPSNNPFRNAAGTQSIRKTSSNPFLESVFDWAVPVQEALSSLPVLSSSNETQDVGSGVQESGGTHHILQVPAKPNTGLQDQTAELAYRTGHESRRTEQLEPLDVPQSSRILLRAPTDTWRTIRSSTMLSSDETTYQYVCLGCHDSGRDVSYCNICAHMLCNICWDKQLVHRSKKTGSDVHEKTTPAVAEKVRNALAPPKNESAREKLCREDEVTTWFGILRPEDTRTPTFQDYGRLNALMESTDPKKVDPAGFVGPSSDNGRDTRTPSLVSFVGQTGAGKSTVIKLIIDLAEEASTHFVTPVIGARGAHVPTSEDVHLYMDPRSWDSHAPLLFADCEGLEGGEREPVGAIFKKKRKLERNNEEDGGGRFQRALKIISERQLRWAQSKEAGREFAVTNFYPRLLFTFSDVIVFVLKNPRVIEHVFERLVDWAAAAIETSSNQPVLPHAIIVLNATPNDMDDKFWNVKANTHAILDDLARTVYLNETFKRYAQQWRERGKAIETLEHLLLSYYSSVQIIRIPEEDRRPNLMQDQVAQLYNAILTASIAAREHKWRRRMLLDVEDLQAHLNSAFSHFSDTLDVPFDFVQASFENSPIPPDFGGNILKLAINIMDAWKNETDGPAIFDTLSYMVASCIMIDSCRNNKRGAAEQIFPNYLEHIDAALENFCSQHWPCEFTLPGTHIRCVNVASGHGKGHQSKNGKIIAAGNYKSQFAHGDYLTRFRNNVYTSLFHLLGELQKKTAHGADTRPIAAMIHRDQVLQTFYREASHGTSILEEFDSHGVCLCCLFEPPEHVLPCGHVLCTACVRLYGGKNHSINEIEMYACPLEHTARTFTSWTVRLKPKTAGVRIMTLDGGGMRGIVELETLAAIQSTFHDLGVVLPIQCFFDLIIGTSTGGLITLGLGAMNWSVDECLSQFNLMVNEAFTYRAGASLPGVGIVIESFNQSRYETKPLERCLKDAFTDEQFLFGGRSSPTSMASGVKIAVTATSSSGRTAIVLANYNRVSSTKLSYQFLRPEKKKAELKIWEAARATSAAPQYFKPYNHAATQKSYIDGGVFHNNPIEVAERERKLLWPDQEERFPDVVVSLGTATSPSLQRSESKHIAHKGMINYAANLLRLAKNHMATSIECEAIWARFLNNIPRDVRQARLIRLNPELGGDIPALDDVQAMPRLAEDIRLWWRNDPKIPCVALQLIATCFYFELVGNIVHHTCGYTANGRILCRLQSPREVRELGKFFQKKLIGSGRVAFIVTEQEQRGDAITVIDVTDQIVNGMLRRGQFEIVTSIKVRNNLASVEILLRVDQSHSFPISGFPRMIVEDEEQTRTTKEAVASNPLRWAARSRAASGAWSAPSVRGQLSMPNLARSARTSANGNSVLSPSQSSDEMTGAARYLRGAFKALARPVRSRKDKHVPGLFELAAENVSKTWSDDFYFVAERDRETYHSYLSTLSAELDGSKPKPVELDSTAAPPRIVMEMEDTSALYLMRQGRDRVESGSTPNAPRGRTTGFLQTATSIQPTAMTSPVIRDFFTSRGGLQ